MIPMTIRCLIDGHFSLGTRFFKEDSTAVISRSDSCSRRDSADSAGESVPAAQIGQGGEIRHVLRRFTRRRSIRPGASYRSKTRASAAYVRHYHYRCYLLYRVHPGRITIIWLRTMHDRDRSITNLMRARMHVSIA